MATNDFEVAPIGTRQLLEEARTFLRGREAEARADIPARQEIVDANVSPESVSASKRAIGSMQETGDRYARLAGRIDALLAGWEK